MPIALNLPGTEFGPVAGEGGIFGQIADAVERHGYAVTDNALPDALLNALLLYVSELSDSELKHAAIGRVGDRQLDLAERGDQTCWLEAADPGSGGFLAWMERLRLELNRRLYLGLFDYEAHYARYAPGAYYRRHRDAFAGARSNRVLSTVLYLNPGWRAGDGGEMVLYAGDASTVLETLQPLYGRLVVFLSERFPHEVMPTRRTRYSIAGWFRVNASLHGRVDPAH